MICAGPILTIVGLVYLVSATTDTRGEKIDQFNAASAPDILYQRTFGVPWPFECAPPSGCRQVEQHVPGRVLWFDLQFHPNKSDNLQSGQFVRHELVIRLRQWKRY